MLLLLVVGDRLCGLNSLLSSLTIACFPWVNRQMVEVEVVVVCGGGFLSLGSEGRKGENKEKNERKGEEG